MPPTGVDDRLGCASTVTSDSALKWSNGSRQASHTHIDLHAVEPNRTGSRVSGAPHCGQRTDERDEDRAAGGARGRGGGAMP